MSIRVKHRVWVNISRNTDMTDLVYGPEEADRLVQSDIYDQHGGGSIDIDDAGNENLSMGDVTNVKGIYLEVDQECTIKINGGTDEFVLKKSNTTGKAKVFLEATITALNIANASGSALIGHYAIWGTAAA